MSGPQDEQEEPGDCLMKWSLSFSPNSLWGTWVQAGYWSFVGGGWWTAPHPCMMGHIPASWVPRFSKPLGLYTDKSHCWKCPFLLCSLYQGCSLLGEALREVPPTPHTTTLGDRPHLALHRRACGAQLGHSEHGGGASQGPSSLDWDFSRQDLRLHFFSFSVRSTVPSSIKPKQILIEPHARYWAGDGNGGDKGLSRGWEKGFSVTRHLPSESPCLSLKHCALLSSSVNGEDSPGQAPRAAVRMTGREGQEVTDTWRGWEHNGC